MLRAVPPKYSPPLYLDGGRHLCEENQPFEDRSGYDAQKAANTLFGIVIKYLVKYQN